MRRWNPPLSAQAHCSASTPWADPQQIKTCYVDGPGQPSGLLEQIRKLSGPWCPGAWSVLQMVFALCLVALAGIFLRGQGHTSFPGLWAGCLGQYKHLVVDLIASMV